MVLPSVLENIMSTVSEENVLLSWNIFQGQEGIINFKLRFQNGQDSANHVRPVSYKRKTAKEVQRHLDRRRLWRNSSNHQAMQATADPTIDGLTSSSTPKTAFDSVLASQCDTQTNACIGVRTRSMTKIQPEIMRSDDDRTKDNSLNPNAESFTMSFLETEDSRSSDIQGLVQDSMLDTSLNLQACPKSDPITVMEKSIMINNTFPVDTDIEMDYAIPVSNSFSVLEEKAVPIECTKAKDDTCSVGDTVSRDSIITGDGGIPLCEDTSCEKSEEVPMDCAESVKKAWDTSTVDITLSEIQKSLDGLLKKVDNFNETTKTLRFAQKPNT
jgi:hypothetical protein